MNKAILNTEDPQYAEKLQELGYDIIPTDEIPCDMPYERRHADMQCLIINNTAFVLSCCTGLSEALYDDFHVIHCVNSFKGKYPHNVCLNALYINNSLICRTASLDKKVIDYCDDNQITLINTNQGYAKCSCAVVSGSAIITSDKGIIRALQDTQIDVLTIGQGSIELKGTDHGFIGGASGYDKARKTLYFCGDIGKHPDGDRIRNFCEKHETNIVCLSGDILTDIGGILFC